MYSQHRQVVALLGLAHKLVDGVFHFADEAFGLVPMLGKQLLGQSDHAGQSELGVVEVFGLGEPVGV